MYEDDDLENDVMNLLHKLITKNRELAAENKDLKAQIASMAFDPHATTQIKIDPKWSETTITPRLNPQRTDFID